MEVITLLIAAGAAALVFTLTPLYGLVAYVMALMWYPSYLTVKVGTLDFTAHRLIIIAIFLNLYLRGDIFNRFKLILLDKLLILYFAAQIIALARTTPIMVALENRSGAMFDILLPYFAARLIIKDKRSYMTLLKWILPAAAILSLLGFYQCLTGNNPFGFLKEYHAWIPSWHYQPVARLGLFRADVTFPMCIMYGLFLAMIGPICATLLSESEGDKKFFYTIGIVAIALGVFSSMSSGPLLAALTAIAFIIFYPYRKHWKLAVFAVLIMCIAVEIISNRHFYNVIDRITLNSQTAWYRSRLIEIALFEGGMSGHWLTGYGFQDPGWGYRINGIATDMVNHYLLVLGRYGLLGFVPFVAIIVTTFKALKNSFAKAVIPSDRWLIWCLSASLFGLLFAFNSVSMFGQVVAAFYIMLGFCGSVPAIVREGVALSYEEGAVITENGLYSPELIYQHRDCNFTG